MKPLLQQASRALTAGFTCLAPSSRPSRALLRARPSICLPCQYRAASTAGHTTRAQSTLPTHEIWSRRTFSSSARWLEDRKPSNPPQPIPMPPPASEPRPVPAGHIPGRTPELVSSLAGQEGLQEQPHTLLDKETNEPNHPADTNETPNQPSGAEAQQSSHQERASNSPKHDIADTITRVPDEQLPSHRERQRWDFSKRLSKLMDEVLPKLAAVTQKVNTYTGTDYSGVEALRREIKEQENLVKARRTAIDTAKQSLDTAHAQQASAQKEVVALLERKHSWSAGDLERYMSLIRSEHINDQAIRVAKESVVSAEAALEEARTQLEKRERAQYHEEQIWSDTIRRNSTWVTFVLMGVNIFLLLLSLAILEPWRRRRMVREIKDVLETQRPALAAAPASVAPIVTPSQDMQDISAIEEEIDRVTQVDHAEAEPATPTTSTIPKEVSIAETEETPSVASSTDRPETPESVIDPQFGVAAPGALAMAPADPEALPQANNEKAEVTSTTPRTWQDKATAIAQDVVSHRVISMRRIDYTTAILQGAAAGALITAAIIGLFGQN